MINSKSEILNSKQSLISKPLISKNISYFDIWNSCLFRISILGFIILLSLGNLSASSAMGNKPKVKEEPKYKLEILKMEIITIPSITSTTSVPSTTIKSTKHKKKH
jgi:hypothetical protein